MRIKYESNDGVVFDSKEDCERRDKIQAFAREVAKAYCVGNLSTLEHYARMLWGVLINQREEVLELLRDHERCESCGN